MVLVIASLYQVPELVMSLQAIYTGPNRKQYARKQHTLSRIN